MHRRRSDTSRRVRAARSSPSLPPEGETFKATSISRLARDRQPHRLDTYTPLYSVPADTKVYPKLTAWRRRGCFARKDGENDGAEKSEANGEQPPSLPLSAGNWRFVLFSLAWDWEKWNGIERPPVCYHCGTFSFPAMVYIRSIGGITLLRVLILISFHFRFFFFFFFFEFWI